MREKEVENLRFQNGTLKDENLRLQIATSKGERMWSQITTASEDENMRLQIATASTDEALRLQIATLNNHNGRGQHRKYLPYVFTEQGIAMLSGLLKNETAIQVSINIMNAFFMIDLS